MDGFNSRPIKNHALGSLSKEIVRCYKIMEFIQHVNPKEMLKNIQLFVFYLKGLVKRINQKRQKEFKAP